MCTIAHQPFSRVLMPPPYRAWIVLDAIPPNAAQIQKKSDMFNFAQFCTRSGNRLPPALIWVEQPENQKDGCKDD